MRIINHVLEWGGGGGTSGDDEGGGGIGGRGHSTDAIVAVVS